MKYTFVTQKQLDEKLKVLDQNIKRGETSGLIFSYAADLLDQATVYFDALLAHKNGASIEIDKDLAISQIKASANEAERVVNQLLNEQQYHNNSTVLCKRAIAYAFQGKFAAAEHDLEEAESLIIDTLHRRVLNLNKGYLQEIKIQLGKFDDDTEAQIDVQIILDQKN